MKEMTNYTIPYTFFQLQVYIQYLYIHMHTNMNRGVITEWLQKRNKKWSGDQRQ